MQDSACYTTVSVILRTYTIDLIDDDRQLTVVSNVEGQSTVNQ